jgi:hypothetical protein
MRRFLLVCLIGLGSVFGGSGFLLQSSSTPPPNSIACDIGPNYTGTIPVQAQQQGFTHCAANYDFTSPQFATISSWLNQCGASPGLFRVAWPSPPNCSSYTIETDPVYGNTMLHMHYDPAQGTSFAQTDLLESIAAFPGVGLWMQGTFRNDAHNDTVCPTGQFCINTAFWYYAGDGLSTAFMEWDTVEIYMANGVFNSATMAGGAWNCGGGTHCGPTLQNSNWETVSGYNDKVYNTYAALITNDGTDNASWCGYLNGTNLGTTCAHSGGYSSLAQGSQIFQSVNHLRLQLGPQGGPTPTGVEDTYYKQIVIFTCPGYGSTYPTSSTGNCHNATVRTTP